MAKKYFKNIKDYKQERDIMKKLQEVLGNEKMNDIMLGVYRYDVKNRSIYYRAGNCNLNELIIARMK